MKYIFQAFLVSFVFQQAAFAGYVCTQNSQGVYCLRVVDLETGERNGYTYFSSYELDENQISNFLSRLSCSSRVLYFMSKKAINRWVMDYFKKNGDRPALSIPEVENAIRDHWTGGVKKAIFYPLIAGGAVGMGVGLSFLNPELPSWASYTVSLFAMGFSAACMTTLCARNNAEVGEKAFSLVESDPAKLDSDIEEVLVKIWPRTQKIAWTKVESRTHIIQVRNQLLLEMTALKTFIDKAQDYEKLPMIERRLASMMYFFKGLYPDLHEYSNHPFLADVARNGALDLGAGLEGGEVWNHQMAKKILARLNERDRHYDEAFYRRLIYNWLPIPRPAEDQNDVGRSLVIDLDSEVSPLLPRPSNLSVQ